MNTIFEANNQNNYFYNNLLSVILRNLEKILIIKTARYDIQSYG